MSINPKKSLGQNWLTSESAIKKIVTTGAIIPGEVVVEVGPGKGALTKALLEARARVIAIEKDQRLIPELESRFQTDIQNKSLTVIEGDVLERSNIVESVKNYKVIANIPYYITGELMRFFLERKNPPTAMVLLVQKEVAERVVARNGKESILSISVKAYGTPRLVAKVPAGAFFPKPNVDSAILLITGINRRTFQEIDEKKFFELIKTGFAQKRKLLRKNLDLEEGTLIQCNISPTARAEELSVEQWNCLCQKISHQ